MSRGDGRKRSGERGPGIAAAVGIAAGASLEEYLARRFYASTARDVTGRVRRYVAYVGEAAALGATYPEVLAYVGALRRAGLSARSLHLALSALKAYYEWLLESGRRGDHPCRTLVLADAVDRRIRADRLYEASELAGLLANYRANDVRDQRRGEVIVGLLVHQALTTGEVTRLVVGDVDLIAGTLHVGGGGKTAARDLALRASQVMCLHAYLSEDRGRYVEMAAAAGGRTDYLLFDTRGGQLVGSGLRRLINVGRSESERLGPQRIRQSVIAGLVAGGHDVRVVQAFAGHKTATATEQYRASGYEELVEAVVRCHPRDQYGGDEYDGRRGI